MPRGPPAPVTGMPPWNSLPSAVPIRLTGTPSRNGPKAKGPMSLKRRRPGLRIADRMLQRAADLEHAPILH